MLTHAMTRARRPECPLLGIAIVWLSATLPGIALASGEASAIDPSTAAGSGAAVVVAIGALAYAVRALASRGTDAAPPTPSGGGVDAAQSVALAELRTELRHLAQRVDRHAQLHDRTRDDITDAVRSADRVDGRVASIDERVAALGSELRAFFAEFRGGGSQG